MYILKSKIDEEKQHLAQETKRIQSLPKEKFRDIMEQCDAGKIREIAENYGFDLYALAVIYNNFIDEKKQKEQSKKEAKQLNQAELIHTVIASKYHKTGQKYLVGKNFDGVVIFAHENTKQNRLLLNRKLLEDGKQLIKERNFHKSSRPEYKCSLLWEWYFSHIDDIETLNQEFCFKSNYLTHEEKEVCQLLKIKLWELNRPQMTHSQLQTRLQQLSILLGRIKIDEKAKEKQKTVPNLEVTEEQRKEMALVEKLLQRGFSSTKEMEAHSSNTLKVTTLNHVVTFPNTLRFFTRRHKEAKDFFKRMAEEGLTREDLSNLLKDYYDASYYFMENWSLLNDLKTHQTEQKITELLVRSQKEIIPGYETNIGYLSKEEILRLNQKFPIFCIVNIESKKDFFEYTCLFHKQSTLEINEIDIEYMKRHTKIFLEELKQHPIVHPTETFQKLVSYFEWWITQENVIESFQNQTQPKFLNGVEKVKK